jgi:hypothetical protein
MPVEFILPSRDLGFGTLSSTIVPFGGSFLFCEAHHLWVQLARGGGVWISASARDQQRYYEGTPTVPRHSIGITFPPYLVLLFDMHIRPCNRRGREEFYLLDAVP